MSLTSLQFFVLFVISLGVYYIIPRKFQWCALLAYSVYFFCVSCEPVTIAYLLAGVLAAVLAGGFIQKYKKAGNDAKAKIALLFGIAVNFGLLVALKYLNFLTQELNRVIRLVGFLPEIPQTDWAAPIGISFYTMSVLSYLLDVYWGICEPQENGLKMALFAGYWPQLTSGPIVRYREVEDQLYTGHKLKWKNITFGLQRMLWGIFKKLVISARAGVLVDTIYADTVRYDGCYIWFAAAMFMVQLYTDFSGCMDIILGASECYGIALPENFRTPFFSRSVQEFWQRWHITLGSWMKDYILYPVLRSGAWRKLTKSVKARFGKKAAKQIPSYLGMLCVWLLVGLWHGGGWKYILGQGMWFFACIALSQALEPQLKKLTALLHINTETFSWHLFQSLRVFALVSVGNMFFRLKSFKITIHTIVQGLTHWNPEIFFDNSLYGLGLSEKDFRLLIVSMLVLLVVSLLQEKGSVRVQLARQNLVFRWGIFFLLIGSILLFGMYGPGYDAQSFIYEAF